MSEEEQKPDVEKIRQLITMMERRGLSRLVLTEGGMTTRLEVATSQPAPVAPSIAGALPASDAFVAQPPPAPDEPLPEPEPPGIPLISPTTGTFYRAPSPGEPPFVDVGDVVELGQTLGIIMAMKVMSEIPAEVAGTVTAIPAKDGELVQTGATLVVIQPSE